MVSQNSFSPPFVLALLILNGSMYLLEIVSGDSSINVLALWPLVSPGPLMFGQSVPNFEFWQLVSYSFLHGSFMHLLVNMYALWLFGSRMERIWGSQSFAIYYFFCVIGAGLVQLFIATQGVSAGGAIYPTIGASGGVFGVLLAFGMTFPNERLMLIFPPVVLKAKWFVLIYGGIELFAGVTGTQAGVAHFAHLGGMLFGFILLQYWRRYPPGYS